MTAAPDADVRAALDDATRVAGLTFSPDAVLEDGHRAVRRRRMSAVGLVAGAAAVVAVVAVQLGSGQPRALPAGTESSRIDESAQMHTDGSADSLQTWGVRVEITDADDGMVDETWFVLDGPRPVKAVRREVPRPQVGRTSLLLPAESGLDGVVAGWVDTGSTRTTGVSPVYAPGGARGGPASRLQPAEGAAPSTRYLFLSEPGGQDAARLAGVVWSDVRGDADPTKQSSRAALTPNDRTDIDRAVLTDTSGQQWLCWADDDRFGVLSVAGVLDGPDGPGALRTLPVPARRGEQTTPDLVFGWAEGSAPVTARSSVSTDDPVLQVQQVGRRSAFLVSPTARQLAGALTVAGGGTSTTVDLARARRE